jgi:hypothetical protein
VIVHASKNFVGVVRLSSLTRRDKRRGEVRVREREREKREVVDDMGRMVEKVKGRRERGQKTGRR